MRVLMLGWEFPPHIAGGLGTACLALTRALSAQGVDVLFVVPERRGGEPAGPWTLVGGNDVPAADTRAVPGVPKRIGVPGPVSPYARPRAARGAAPYDDLFGSVLRYGDAVAEVARREPFDLVHAHDWMTFAAGAAAAKAHGKPLVAHVHSSEHDRSPRGPDPAILAAEQAGFHAADAVVCVSAFTAALLARRYRVDPARLRVVHNALPDVPAAAAPAAQRRSGGPVVLFLGRVTAQKGPDLLLEAAVRVVAAMPEVKFVFAGDGDLFRPTVERAASLGLARHVAFTGFLGPESVERAYAEADVFVLSSLSEPFGLTALEAAARGVPVVLTRASGAAEVLPSALRADVWDGEDLADKILAVLRRPALRGLLRREGRREAQALTWDAVAERVRAVYAEVSS
jgi:glycosyltransferase involved in cell wall biosynthesis